MKKFISVVSSFTLIFLLVAPLTLKSAASEPGDNGRGNDDNITICHRTASASNPYTLNTIDENAQNGGSDHQAHVSGLEGDIIPITDVNGGGIDLSDCYEYTGIYPAEDPIEPVINVMNICSETGIIFTVTSDMSVDGYTYKIYRVDSGDLVDSGRLELLTILGYNINVPPSEEYENLRIEILNADDEVVEEVEGNLTVENCNYVEEEIADPIKLTGECKAISEDEAVVLYIIRNIGEDDMIEALEYRVYRNDILSEDESGTYQLEGVGEDELVHFEEVIVEEPGCDVIRIEVDLPNSETISDERVCNQCSEDEDGEEESEEDDSTEDLSLEDDGTINPSPGIPDLTTSDNIEESDETSNIEEVESNNINANLGDGGNNTEEDSLREDTNATLDSEDDSSNSDSTEEENTTNNVADSTNNDNTGDGFVSVGTNLLAIILESLIMTLAILGNFYFRKKVRFNN
jgi:hypothetical protein